MMWRTPHSLAKKRIREQPAVTAPGHGFGAQERAPLSGRELFHFGHDRLECGSQHEVGRRQEVENAIAAFPYLQLWRSRILLPRRMLGYDRES